MLARAVPCRPCRLTNARLAHTLRTYKEDPRWPGWEVIVGIEVHAQIKSRTKLFSDALTSDPGVSHNAHVSAFDAAFPGTLPRLNPICVDLALRTAIALKSDVQRRSTFDRKHYFYSDLPAGYQITQRYEPIARGGVLHLSSSEIAVGIEQIQLEQDTGKSTFDARHRVSTIDLSRAGTGLMEIVSQPDMRSPEEAAEYVRSLQALLRSVGSSDGNMEQGSLRCDVNVSVNKPGQSPGTRCEIKNLNSVRFMMAAIASEVFRHISVLKSGESVSQETRGFDEDSGVTFRLRSKEDAPDYRYMPDPNLPPLLLDTTRIERIREAMPELPDETRARLQILGLSRRDIDVLTSIDSGWEVGYNGEIGKGATAYFDALSVGRDPKVVVNWMTHELLGQLTIRRKTFRENPLSLEQMGSLIDLVQNGVITGSSGKTLLRHMLDHPSSEMPIELAGQLSLLALQEGDSLDQLCAEAIAALPEEAEAVRRGNVKVLNKLTGRVMKSSRGTADALSARKALERLLIPGGANS
ncbi:Glutamyl-tRNA amidotransferase B subunit [Artomyces pyxidatus]|uniref:Glutamyl-tRNA amidotransferase B subunit n=1 Tax=Artomyces pyxidatus TaxID=48021 RepID=A0ACB8TJH1_9AGAM|nr:Glutamyl-tRNA amidotransferase B subunit [Artomyces pyxidatus]